ncbi:MAG: TonB-dependent receptor [Pyrinomonadaceae bacterium]
MRRLYSFLLLVLLSSAVVFAQSTTGRLVGSVSSTDGVMPGATVTVIDNNTGKEQTITTGADGGFLLPQLEFGTYTVKITASGFKTYIANEVKIDVGRDYSLNPVLEIGDISESVTVTAGADVVTSTTAQVSNTVSPQQILSLPLITRSPLTLTTLQAGVQSNPFQGTSINGMRTTMTNITRDGINIQDTFIRSNATDFAPGRPSVDDTGEFTITTANQEADQGYGGAQIRLVTPRGTKNFSGALFAYNRNSEFAANTFFNNRQGLDRPFRNRNQYGGKLSGPMPVPGIGEGTPFLFMNKGFFFFNYEGIKDPVTAAATRTILTPGARNGAFSWRRTNATAVTPYCPSQTVGSVCTIPNILTFARATVANGATIPGSIDPYVQANIIGRLPTESNFTGGDGLNTAGFRLLRGSNQVRDQYSTRIDVDFDENNSILGIFNYNVEENLRPDVDTNGFEVTPNVTQSSTNKQFTMAYRRVFASNFVNEVRGGVFTSEVPFDRTLELPGFHIGVPLVTNPSTGFMSQGRNTKSYNFQNNADWILGNHNLKFGGQLQFFAVNAYNDAGIVPTYSLGTGTNTPSFSAANFTSIGGINSTQLGAANGLMSLLGGVVAAGSQSFNIQDLSRGFEASRQIEPIRHSNHSLYLADRWMFNSQLTFNLGLRWEVYPSLRLLNNLALEPVIDDADNILPSLLRIDGTYNVIGGNSGSEQAYYRTQWNNFAPNLGLAWAPTFDSGIGKFLFGSRSVIRAGYSHIFGNDSIITSIRNAAIGNQGLARTTSNAINPLTGTTALNDRLGGTLTPINPPAFIQPPRTYLQNNQLAGFFGTVFAIDPNIEVPRTEQYSIGFQREFFGNTAFEIRYIGTRSNNLARGVDLNQVDIFDNGFLDDFNRARGNLLACEAHLGSGCTTGGAFNALVPGSQALTLFPRLPSGGLLSNSTVVNQLRTGVVADLAILYISNGLNNHPTVANPGRTPFIDFLSNPGTGVVDLLHNDGWFHYNSFQAEIRRRFSAGLYFQANYTFSKNLTNAVGTSQALFEPFLDNNNKDLDVQRADFDQTHIFNFNGVYQLPFGRGKMFINKGGILNALIGGWELSGLAQWTTGAPITFTDGRGTLNRAGRSGRQTPNSSLTNDQIRSLIGIFEQDGRIYWIDPSILNSSGQASSGFGEETHAGQVFFNVEPGQTGNLGRMIVDGPRFFNINAALLKNINFTETMRVQLRAEAFNLLNNTNFFNNTQFAGIGSTSFGQITSAAGSRQMQFAVRFEF